MIAIYDGEGARWEGKGRRIKPQEIRRGELQNISFFIMPGGRDRLYHQILQGEGNAKIRSFVENGGTYLGICAGGYYGCKRVEFDRGFPLEVCEERELAFFSGTGIGPAYGGGTFSYDSEKGARLAKIGTANGVFYSYYNGGCFFEGDFTHIRILARYLDLPDLPPAIIECPVGRGKAILSGVHLEKRLSHLPQRFPSDEMEMEMGDRLARIGAVIR